jgi:hypothetical protein
MVRRAKFQNTDEKKLIYVDRICAALKAMGGVYTSGRFRRRIARDRGRGFATDRSRLPPSFPEQIANHCNGAIAVARQQLSISRPSVCEADSAANFAIRRGMAASR